MSSTKCFKCKGRGWSRSIDWFCGVFTLGMSALIDASEHIPCNACDGKGYLDERP